MPALGALVRVSIHRARPLPFLGLRLLPHHRRRLLYPIWYFDAIENLEGAPPGGGSPPWGRSPSGGKAPALQGAGCPPGGKTISFSAEKETVLHPKEKDGARSTVG